HQRKRSPVGGGHETRRCRPQSRARAFLSRLNGKLLRFLKPRQLVSNKDLSQIKSPLR
ncbi:MAG: hypothetical protein OD815_001931, partial [Candidatus Alkanophagales archaeon MCA70_species_2]|nr:hypothetical protein [Candidatus Alkanophaga liquidiphilum]